MQEEQRSPECPHGDVVEDEIRDGLHGAFLQVSPFEVSLRSLLAGHSGRTANPDQRPNTKTRSQQASEIPPARRAGSGGLGVGSQSFTPRTVMNSQMNMLMPAASMTAILIQNVGVTKYWVAWLMNS